MTSRTTRSKPHTYTLNDIIDGIEARQDTNLRPPALPTLKLWSQKGHFRGAATLDQAIEVVLAMQQGRARYYPKADTHQRVGHLTPSEEGRAFGQVLEELQAIRLRIDDIVKSPQKNSTQMIHFDPSVDSLVRTLTEAIAQVDTMRRHMLVRFDNELQLLKSTSTPQRSADGADALDMHRLIARLGRMEATLARIAPAS